MLLVAFGRQGGVFCDAEVAFELSELSDAS